MSLTFTNCLFHYARREQPAVEIGHLTLGRGRTILLGPNGAGKSTLLALGASSLLPVRGSVTLDGLDARRSRDRRGYRARVGWMPQQIQPMRGLRVREQVALSGWLKGMSRAKAWDSAGSALERTDLSELSNRRTHQLSGGQRTRMGLAQALVHDAEILLLDEPVAALDPSQRELFLKMLADLSADRSIVVSTHDVNDLANAFDHVVLISGGRVLFAGAVESFLSMGGGSGRPVDAYNSVMGRER